MKKLVSTILSFSTLLGIVPLVSSAKTLYVHNGLPEWSATFVSGDTNNDGSVNIADAVILNKYLVQGYTESTDIICLDVNSDGFIDSFDLVSMRNLVLNPDSAVSENYTIDILQSPAETVPDGKIITDTSSMIKYLSSFIEDEAEISVYTERYNDAFFEENNLFLQPLLQERGRGIFYTVSGSYRTADETINLVISPNYESYRALYPVTNTQLLIQTTFPKSQSRINNSIDLIDNYKNLPAVSSHSYYSPDGEKEIYITQESFMNVSDIRIYLKSSAIAFSPLASITTENGFLPFSDDGEWHKNSDGIDVFGDGVHYSITWHEDSIVINYMEGNGIWNDISLILEPQTDPDEIR
ncbi:MAG: dockerin type I repeat-containing protein [Ruminococcus sp.]|nr:dockerin type I repeat-containing protein [Ruminococcus sp.]